MVPRFRSWGLIAPLLLAFTIACSSAGDSARQDTASSTRGATAVSSTPSSVEPSTVLPSITLRPATATPTEVPPTSTPTVPGTATQSPLPTNPAPTPQAEDPITIVVSAENLTFDRAAISVPANTQITVNFTNNDAAIPHDFGVSVPFVPHSETCFGPCSASITFDSGQAGSYSFQCSIHPEMVGSFLVQ